MFSTRYEPSYQEDSGLEEHSSTNKDAEKIIKFVCNHHLVKGKFEQKRKVAKIGHTLSMLVPTCWYSRYIAFLDEVRPRPMAAVSIALIKSTDFWEGLSKTVKLIDIIESMLSVGLKPTTHSSICCTNISESSTITTSTTKISRSWLATVSSFFIRTAWDFRTCFYFDDFALTLH